MNRIQIPAIAGGISEGTTEAVQPAGTYIDGENVRGIDPRSGRLMWGAQRPGMEKVAEESLGSGVFPRHLFESERLELQERWVNLTTTPAADTEPDSVKFGWTASLGSGQVLDMVSGLEGMGYYLLDTGEVVLVNASGGVSERIPGFVPVGMRPVPRIAVDTEGGVFLAATADDPLIQGEYEGAASIVMRLTKDSSDIWSQVWETRFESRMGLFGYADGSMYLVLDAPEPEEGERPPAELVRMAAPLSTGAIAWRQGPIPRPTFDVTIGRGGSCLLSCPASPARFGADGVMFTERTVTWTPWELPAPADQLYAWIEADNVNDSTSEPEDGAAIEVMNDRRKLPNPFIELGGPDRDARKPPGFVFDAPVWDATAFGGIGGVKFSPGAALRSGRNLDQTAEGQTALIPADDGWGFVAVVQLDEAAIAAATTRYLWSHVTSAAGQANLRAIQNGDQLTMTDEAAGPASTNVADVGTYSPGGSRAAVIALHFPTAGGAPAWRINGNAMAAGAAWPNGAPFGPYALAATAAATVPGPQTVLGEGNPNERDFVRLAQCSLSSGAGTQGSLSNVRDGNVGTHVFLSENGTSTFAYIIVDLTSTTADVDGIDTLNLVTDAAAVRVTVSVDGVAPTGSPPAPASSTFDMEFDLNSSIPRVDHGHGQGYGYDLRLPNNIPIVGRYVLLRFTPSGANGFFVRVGEVGIKAQDLARAADPETWTLWGMCVLTTGSIGNIERLEGYFARKVGLLHELAAGHPFKSTWPAAAGDIQDPGAVREKMRSPYPMLVKWGSDGSPIAAEVSAGVGLGAVMDPTGAAVLTVGEPDPYGTAGAPNSGTLARKITDGGRQFTGVWSVAAGTEIPLTAPTRLATGPCGSLFMPFRPGPGSAGANSIKGIRRYTSAGALSWTLAAPLDPLAVAPGGLLVDESAFVGGACGPEFLFSATVGGPRAQRVEVTGRVDTGVPDAVVVSRIAVDSTGALRRLAADGSSWSTISGTSGLFRGSRPWSETIYGFVIIGDGRVYRVYDMQNDTLRDFAASVKGYLPPRAKLALAHRGRLYLAAADNPYAIYASRYGDVFDWDLGPIVEDVAQAVAGTTSSQGAVPERITALMPLTDDVILVGTARSLYALTGDLGEGGRLDLVDRSNGVAFGYAWCIGSRGLYYFSASGGVWLRTAEGAQLVSAGKIQRRLEDIDQRLYRIELGYRWQDRTVHVFVIPATNFVADLTHYVLEEATGAWHLDRFSGGVARQVTSVSTLRGGASHERTLALGFVDGYVRELAAWADDDDGEPIGSRALIGPLLPPSEAREGHIRALYGQLASDQGPIEVGVRAGDALDSPGPLLETGILEPGRGYGVTVRGAGAALFIEVAGLGRAWSVHQLEADAMLMGEKGSRQ